MAFSGRVRGQESANQRALQAQRERDDGVFEEGLQLRSSHSSEKGFCKFVSGAKSQSSTQKGRAGEKKSQAVGRPVAGVEPEKMWGNRKERVACSTLT